MSRETELENQVYRMGNQIKELTVSLSQVQDRAKDTIEDLTDALRALLGAPDYLTEYECEHGTPLGQRCKVRNCHLRPVRLALKHLPH